MLITDRTQLTPYYAGHRVWQGIPGIARTKGGRTFIAFYSGNTCETYGNFCLLLKSETDQDFGEPIAVIEKKGKFRCFDPVLWIDPLDRLWFIWNVMPGEEVWGCICENPDAETLHWGEEFYIGRGIMMNKPTVLSTGEWLFPIALWRKDLMGAFRKNGLREEDAVGSYVYKTADNGKTFSCLGMAQVRSTTFDEHMILELNNGVLMMLVRTAYGIGRSYSYDRGKSWSAGQDSGLKGPNSRFHLRRLRSGRVLLINHFEYTGRNNLTALLSEDDGKTFPYRLLLDSRENVSYPDATQAEDGTIYIVYDRERGGFKQSLEEVYDCAREVLTAKITEEDILAGKLVDPGSFLQNVVCKLEKLAPEDGDPFDQVPLDVEVFADELLQEGGDVVEKIFLRYPENCISAGKTHFSKLDSLIKGFLATGSQDRDTLVRILDLIRQIPITDDNPHPTVQRVVSYLEQNLSDDFSVAQVAEEMNISVYYLSHLFKSVTGITLVEYRNELRLTKAKQLLLGSEKTISEIAIACGFSNASYFTEVFTRSEKIPPREFRKYHAGK